MAAPWPFAMWGLDLLGPFPIAVGRKKFLVVACDYFTKWVEAEALAAITQEATEKFIWQNIICRFGVPHAIITDNGKQLQSKLVKGLCDNFNIQLRATSVSHPEANGLVEAMNGKIMSGLKKKLDDAKTGWLELVPEVLWSIRTTPHSTTGETPFNLTYGSEAVIPAEIGAPTYRTSNFMAQENEESLRLQLDLLEETRDDAAMTAAVRSQQVSRYFNKRVRDRQFQVGDYVLRSCEASRPAAEQTKLAPKWEGPYQIKTVLGKGAYFLKTTKGADVSRAWNAAHLKKYY